MLISCLFLAISSSIDSLGIGITYGIKNTKIIMSAKFILFFISFIISIISIYFGNLLKYILPDFFIHYLGSFILILMGLFMCFQSLKVSKQKHKMNDNKNLKDTKCLKNTENSKISDTEKIYSFFIKCLGITIKIIKNPNSSDFDKSNIIDSKEALFLGLALSLDSFCIGIGLSMINTFSLIFPLLISCFQLFFLSLGNYLGKKLYSFNKLPDNIWSIISGILLIIIGFWKIL